MVLLWEIVKIIKLFIIKGAYFIGRKVIFIEVRGALMADILGKVNLNIYIEHA